MTETTEQPYGVPLATACKVSVPRVAPYGVSRPGRFGDGPRQHRRHDPFGEQVACYADTTVVIASGM